MRSAEVARIAGVSVRTLRHYHRLGLMPEPARRSNGYRTYRAADVTRLLRIRLLTEAGLPLARIGALVDGATPGEDELEGVEEDLTARIDALTAQRDLARALRTTTPEGDLRLLPPSLAPFLGRSPDGIPPKWSTFDDDLALVLYLSANSQERQQLESLYAEVSSPVRAPRVGEVVVAFAALTDLSTRASVDAVVQAALHLSAELRRPVPVTLSRLKLSAVAVMIELGPFNKAQRVVLKRLLSSAPAPARTAAAAAPTTDAD